MHSNIPKKDHREGAKSAREIIALCSLTGKGSDFLRVLCALAVIFSPFAVLSVTEEDYSK
jgi:hypothetical protein